MLDRTRYLKRKKDKKTKKRIFSSVTYPEITSHINDMHIITTVGDRLDLLAQNYYKDSRLWWVIANANRDIIEKGSYHLKSGLQIRIPANVNNILKNFERLNY